MDEHLHKVVPEAGLEPAWYRYRRILSPLRLPISPLGHVLYNYTRKKQRIQLFKQKRSKNFKDTREYDIVNVYKGELHEERI